MRTYFLYILLYKKMKVLRFCGPKKHFFTYVCNFETLPLPRCTQSYVFSLKPPLPSPTPNCAYVLCRWPPKVFERLLYDSMFSCFSENDLISPKQFGFRPCGSCTNQLLSTAHETLPAFVDSLEVRSFFLDISKAFHRVWHECLLFKLQQNGYGESWLLS